MHMSNIPCIDIERMVADRRSQAERLRFFDAEIWLGRPAGFPCAPEITVEEIPQILQERYLTGGLVSHWRSATYSAQEANQALLDAMANAGENLYAVWTGLPLFPQEDGPLPGVGDLPEIVRAVRIFPKAHKFPMTEWCIGSLCEWLIDRKLPLFVWHTEMDWPSLYQLARAFPALSIVVESQVQKILYHTRALFPLMRDCRNVLVELSNFAGQGFVEYAVREFGPERLIFGSFLPVSDPLVPIGMVLDSAISDADRKLIAGDNLRRLIGEGRA